MTRTDIRRNLILIVAVMSWICYVGVKKSSGANSFMVYLKVGVIVVFVLAVPLGYIAIEAGWIVTEVGRQPWIIYNIMRTRDAVTPMPGIVYSFYLFSAVYVSLAVIVTVLLHRQIKMVPVLYDVPERNIS